ncbi:MAG: class I SAM-dependent methyltransferase, partial [Chloroflexota bacterium]
MSIANRDRSAALARLYDLDVSVDPGDVDLYLALAARVGGPIVELCAGSGRIAVPLAVAGYNITAVDLDDAMLDRAARRATYEGPDVEARFRRVYGDLRSVAIPGAG